MAEKPKEEPKVKDVPENKNGSMIKTVVIIGVLVVVMATGIAFGVAKLVLSTTAQPNGAAERKEASNVAMLGSNYEAGEFLTNINSEAGLRFAKVKLVFELSNEKVKEELENKRPKVDDTIISVLRNKSFEELRQVDATDKLKKELKEKVNTFLAEGRVENVFFTYFITQ